VNSDGACGESAPIVANAAGLPNRTAPDRAIESRAAWWNLGGVRPRFDGRVSWLADIASSGESVMRMMATDGFQALAAL